MRLPAKPGPDYLDEPVEGLHQIHGRFDDEARQKAMVLKSETPGKIMFAAAGVTLLALCRWCRRKR